MTLIAFSILDTKSGAFNTPFFFPARGLAVRAFGDLVDDAQSTISKHPDDYRLFEVGTFDLDSGKLTALDSPKFMSSAVEFLHPQPAVVPVPPKEPSNA